MHEKSPRTALLAWGFAAVKRREVPPINRTLGLTMCCWRGLGGFCRRSSSMSTRVASRVFLLITVSLIAATVGGCKTTGTVDTTGSISAQRSDADWRRESEALGERFRANPRDPDVAIRYAQALRATGQRAQAAAVLETSALHNPENRALLGAYGRALADVGNFKQALEVLERAHSP